MKSNLEQAKEFREAYQVPNSRNLRQRNMQKRLIDEEYSEFIDAEQHIYRDNNVLHAEALKELADLVYVCYQYAANMEWDLDEACRRVHESNMSKLGDNGQPERREDGKILKGKNYHPPTLTDLVK
tara:strand:- start:658 stop:1035 length:378 start_codon:yes stop_codon:yes gene_type:complete